MLGIHTGRPPRWRLSSRLTIAGALIICGCENDPLVITIPGSAWTLQDTVLRAIETGSIAKTQAQGNSATLFVGFPEDDGIRKAGALLKLAELDSTLISNTFKAQLILLRRTFGDVDPDPDQVFRLDRIEESDTAWREDDTGLEVADFTQLTLAATAVMAVDSLIPFGDTLSAEYEHLTFDIDTLLLAQWHSGSQINNGFLLTPEGPGTLYSFHSSNSGQRPYLSVDYRSEDTTATDRFAITSDLTVFAPPASPPDTGEGSLQLNFSEGIRSYIDFSSAFQFDSTDIISSGRLILYQNRLATSSAASPISVVLSRYSGPGRDSTVALTVVPTYDPAQSDSIVIPLLPLLRDYAAGDANFGIELSLLPASNDFDHIYFWGPGPATPDSAYWPRLEIIYTPDVFGSP